MHKKTSIALICIDYRFWPKTLKLLKDSYSELDVIALAGASKNLLSPIPRKTLFENMAISIKLHGSKKIILTNHIDCGAYGGSKRFKSSKEEILFHKNELKKAKKIIHKKFPKIKIETLIIERDRRNKIKLTKI